MKVEAALASTRKGVVPIDAIASESRGTSVEAKTWETQTGKTGDQLGCAKGLEQSEEKSESVMKKGPIGNVVSVVRIDNCKEKISRTSPIMIICEASSWCRVSE
ncbi:unnamed protein product [Sphenostylis stenocarpa]|uniref:Uncharacterized protein n=1 Tax=Sphenostylis stenocarpa TaxID=92480 RepID=A0AA86T0D8_9FABA|nr:unnamed protein product [Sphenostylis stenocarpa]